MADGPYARRGMSTCGDCSHPVQMVRVGEDLVACEPELTRFVPSSPRSWVNTGRQVHAELCQRYQNDARKARLRQEMAEWQSKNPQAGRKLPGL